MRNKTDKNDARGIAQVLRTGWFSPVHMKPRKAHGQRALRSSRKALLNKTIDLSNEVRGLLKIFGLRLPKTGSHGSFDGIVRPMIQMDDVLVHALVPLLNARAALYQHYLELDRRVKRAASQDDVCMRFMTIPGVGPIAALTFKAGVNDPLRSKNSRTVVAHFGLTPRRYQSGEVDNPGRRSRCTFDALFRSKRYVDAPHGWLSVEIMGNAIDAYKRTATRFGRRCTQACCHSASDVDRRH